VPRRRWLAIVSAAIVAGAAGRLRADTLTLTTGQTYNDVQITGIAQGRIDFTLDGRPQSKPAADIADMMLDDEPNFNAAEAAFELKQWSSAADGFAAAISATGKPWLAHWMALRMLQSANRAKRFGAAVSAWLRIVADDPAAAVANRPVLPPARSQALAAAAEPLQRAASSAAGPARRLILDLLLKVQTARGDRSAARPVAKDLQAGPSLAGLPAPLPEAEEQIRLDLARFALDGGRFDQAVSLLDQAEPLMTDPGKQAQALMLRAQALNAAAAHAGASASAAAWADAALAYMRVYVHFHNAPAAPAALMAAARIEQDHLHDPPAARTLYQKLASEYKGSTQARQAEAAVSRLASPRP
jgi:hypothetical protein